MHSPRPRLCSLCFLISFCIHIFCPQIAIANENTTETGSLLNPNLNPSSSSESSASSATTVAPAQVSLSEVMWMGSDISTADEWVEIAGFAAGISMPRSLSGWTLTVLKGTEEAVITRFSASTMLTAGQTLIIANYTKDASRLALDPFATSTAMSLPNTKLLLRLRDSQGVIVDEVDDGVGNPFAGGNPSGSGPKASMERINLDQPGNVSSNWRSATLSSGFDSGLPIFGTPGSFPQVTSSISSSPNSSSTLSVASSFQSAESSSFSSVSSSNFSTSSIQEKPLIMVKIHELLSNPIGSDDAEWIEVQNEGVDPVNLSGMTIKVGTALHRIKASASGLIVAGGGFVIVPKIIGGFTLTNNGATVQLLSGSTIVDTFIYPLMPEGVSAGRMGDQGSVIGDQGIIPFCIPTPGRINEIIPPDPQIVIQSGNPYGQTPVSLNLSVSAGSGTLTGGTCHFDFGDSFTSDSCNPASHSMKIIGDYSIQMSFTDYCGTTVIRSIQGSVSAKPFSVRSKNIPSKGGVAPVCTPSVFSGVSITELLPNPTGDEAGGEWVELRNDTDNRVSLCGWSLDDGPGGSHPFPLTDFELPAKTLLALPRSQTKIAFNNDHDMARLIAPLQQGGTGAYHTVLFNSAPDDQSYAVDGSGSWIWTPYTTPGDPNRFQEAASLFKVSPLSISAAFPNPDGPDTWDEWIEITNSAAWPIWLNGWVIRNSQGKELDLTGTVLAKLQTKRIYLSRLKYVLGNEHETLSLVDPDNVIRAILPWTNAKEEVTQRPYKSPFQKQTVLVRQVITPGEYVVQLDDDATHLARVRLKGIRFPDDASTDQSTLINKSKYFIRALLLNKKIDLQIDTNLKEKDGTFLASAFVDDMDLQRELLINGYAAVDHYQQDGLYGEYVVYESMARTVKQGLWHSEEIAVAMDTLKEDAQNFVTMKAKGLNIKFDQKETYIASGTLLSIKPNKPALLFVSLNGAAFTPWSGGILVASNQTIRAYAEVDFLEHGSIRSPVIEQTYLVDTDAPKRAVRISEVYPSPQSGETEWIELENRTDTIISLGGWLLDDAENKGSRPWMIPMEVALPPFGRRLFPADVTHLSLSNSGDEVRLLYPSEQLADSVLFKSVKKGRSIAWNPVTSSFCPTDSVTPLESNTCFIQNKKSTQKKSNKKGINKNKNNKKIMPALIAESKRDTSLYDSLLGHLSGKVADGKTGTIFGGRDVIVFLILTALTIGLFLWFKKK